MSEVIVGIAQVAILTFVVSSMVGLGLSLTVQQILSPLKDIKPAVLGQISNFEDTPEVLVTVMVASLVLTGSLLLVAGELGRRAPAPTVSEA